MAIRNQFFTPRYVVQFLTDNTLGRIWYEMRGGDTALKDRCEYLVHRSDEQLPHRPKKDPRDIRILDPACGSGHFLLYSFDLLAAVYEEAYADPDSPRCQATGRNIAQDYPDPDSLRAAIPALILAHNLHGVDIDPRCAQIAQLALWMRAQRAYQDAGLPRGARPEIRRSNVVVAEPLIVDHALANEFEKTLTNDDLRNAFRELVNAMSLAGELGLLSRVESLRATPLKDGYAGDLFVSSQDRLQEALHRYADADMTRINTRRRLFADDSAQGLGLIAIATAKYDTILMNPPFGACTKRARPEFEKAYPRAKNDIYAAFVERAIELLAPRGRLGAITSRTAFFLSSFRVWREEILLRKSPPVVFADLGRGVLDGAMVETAAYCLEAR
ncbi:Eco57I restriction-modification methylase domain-containing protein [Actinoplanes subtropicus]|uniref:Eco57I restriction-modification methylase domain-containing protein n=1 Tax=Actinoplanes subtropicus TaxID=543632 RepID=UPI0012F783FD|nr:DNA methyltransferase [Actinoplanes subtropicus]